VPDAAFGNGLRVATVNWGERPAITGTLTWPGGHPVALARLWVTSRLAMRGAPAVAHGSVRTNRLGRFTFTPRVGPSRAVTFTYGGSASTVELRVVPRITVRVTRTAIKGRVRGAPPGARAFAELQSDVRGVWRTFATTRVAGGAFRLRSRNPPRRVRALIRADPGWPFETGSSAVTSRGAA
jgi:hypothetical protein